MECLGIALVVALVAAPLVLAAMAFQRARHLDRRLALLDAEVQGIARRLDAAAASGAAAPEAFLPPALQPIPPPASPMPPVAATSAASLPASFLSLGSPPLAPTGPSAAPSGVSRVAAVPARSLPSFEELLGGHLLIWIGSIALALAGAFLVKFSFEHGWISPVIRVCLGVLFGLGLLAAGEAARRNSGRISSALSAAGIADLFACFLAAANTYHLVSTGTGFALMALTAGVAVALSLRQGAMVALIGLVGGFLTPALIRTDHPSARNLFAYLFLLVAGLLAVSWKRGWWALAAGALGASLVWVLVWLEQPGGTPSPADAVWLSLFLLAVAAAAAARRRAWESPGGGAPARPAAPSGPEAGSPEDAAAAVAPPFLSMALIPWSLAAILPVLALVVSRAGYSLTEWAFFALLAAGALTVAWLDPLYDGLTWVTAAVAAGMLANWRFATDTAQLDVSVYCAVALAAGAFLAGAGWSGALAFVRWPGSRPRPERWAAYAAATGVAFFLIAWSGSRWSPGAAGSVGWVGPRWGVIALVAAGIYLAALLPFIRRRHDRRLEVAAAALAVAVTTFVSLAVPIELERQWITVGWALEVLALVVLAGRFRLPVLAQLARLLGLGVAVRLLLNPEVLSYPIGRLPVLNWLLYGYGVPLIAFAVAAGRVRRQDWRERPAKDAEELEWAALAFAFVLITLEVRQSFHPGGLTATGLGFTEAGTLAGAWLLLGWGLLRAGRRPRLRSLELSGRALVLMGAAWALVGPGIACNPLGNGDPVGGVPVVNLLLAVFGGLTVLTALAGAELVWRGARDLAALCGASAQMLAFALVSLEVRQAFHGSVLAGPSTASERYCYSAAWLVFGLVLLLAGLLRRGGAGKLLRYGSLAVMLATIGKVFLYDTAHLSDLYRVFSFLGLGASLLLLAFLYQRFVFRKALL